MSHVVGREALTLAFDDVFRLMSYLFSPLWSWCRFAGLRGAHRRRFRNIECDFIRNFDSAASTGKW